MYFDYWGLKKPPFDNVPDPSMYVAYTSVENTIAETLLPLRKGNNAVIVGDVGLGKTMSLRAGDDSLGHQIPCLYHKPQISPLSNSTREIIGQLMTAMRREKSRPSGDILTALFQTVDEGRKVLIFIDKQMQCRQLEQRGLRSFLQICRTTGTSSHHYFLQGQIVLAEAGIRERQILFRE